MVNKENTGVNIGYIMPEVDSMEYAAEAMKIAIRLSANNHKAAGQNLVNLVSCDDCLARAFSDIFDILTDKYKPTKSTIGIFQNKESKSAMSSSTAPAVATPAVKSNNVVAPAAKSTTVAPAAKSTTVAHAAKTTTKGAKTTTKGAKTLKSMGASPADISNIYKTMINAGVLLPEQKGRAKRVDCVQSIYKVYTTLGATKFDRMFNVLKRGNLIRTERILQGNVIRAISEIYANGPVDGDILIDAINAVNIDSLAVSTNNGTRDRKSIGDCHTVASIIHEKYTELCEADKSKTKGKRMSTIEFSNTQVVSA